MELQLKNNSQAFLELQKQSKEIAEQCNKIIITDDDSLQLATRQYSLLKEKINQIELIRKMEKQPYIDEGKQIDLLAKTLSEPLEKSLDEGKKKIIIYNKIKEEAILKEKQRINAIKSDISQYASLVVIQIKACTTDEELLFIHNEYIKRFPGEERWFEFMDEANQMKTTLNDLINNRSIEINNPLESDETVSETIQEVLFDQVTQIASDKVQDFETTTKFRGTWKHKVVDEKQLPREWLMPDDKTIKEWIKNAKPQGLNDGDIINGVKFFIEKTVQIR